MTNKTARKKKQAWWDKFIVPNQILHEGENSTLIILPKGSPFEGYKMWMPNKLVIYDHPFIAMRMTDSMEFTLFKGNKQVKLTGKDMMRINTCGELGASRA